MASPHPDVLLSAERASHLAAALQQLLRLPLPPEALPPLSDVAGVIALEAADSADAIGDDLGVVPASARHGHPRLGC